MSHAGYSEEETGDRLTVRPNVTKTFLKGVIAVAVFSVFLQLSLANLVHYLTFLGLCLGALLIFAAVKRSSTFTLGPEAIEVRRPFRKPNSIGYLDVVDISVSQGMLARAFNCGTVFIILKGGRGSVKMLGGGIAEQLEDVPDPQRVYEFITAKLSPFSSVVEP